MKDSIDIRWHGRGGQGAITAAKIVAKAMFQLGYQGVAMVPTFGTERRGAPVFTSLKISKNKIYDLSPIEKPDIIVVLDHVLLEEGNITNGLKDGGILIVNSPCSLESYHYNNCTVAVCDVNTLAVKAGLPDGMVNSGIIGAFARAGDVIGLDPLVEAIKEEFAERRPEKNALAAQLAYENTLIGG